MPCDVRVGRQLNHGSTAGRRAGPLPGDARGGPRGRGGAASREDFRPARHPRQTVARGRDGLAGMAGAMEASPRSAWRMELAGATAPLGLQHRPRRGGRVERDPSRRIGDRQAIEGPSHLAMQLFEGNPADMHPLKGFVAECALEAGISYARLLGKTELRLLRPLPGALPTYRRLGFKVERESADPPYCFLET